MTEDTFARRAGSIWNRLRRNTGIFAVQFAGIAFGALSQFLLAKVLGPNQYGIFVQGFAFITLSGLTCALGFKTSSMRFIPAYLHHGAREQLASFVWLGLGVVIVVAAAFSLILFVASRFIELPTIGALGDAGYVVMLAIPLHAFVQSIAAMMRGFGYRSLAIAVDRPLRELVTFGGGIYIYFHSGNGALALAFLVAGLAISGIIGLWSVLRRAPRIVGGTMAFDPEWIRRSVPMLGVNLSALLMRRADILLVGYFLDHRLAGIYGFCVMVADVALVPLTTFGILFAPSAARLFAAGEYAKLLRLHREHRVVISVLTLAGVLPAFLFAGTFLDMVAPAYVDGVAALRILMALAFVRATFGNSNFLLMMANSETSAAIISISSAVLAVLAEVAVIPEFGITGAALVTGTAVVGQAALFEYFGRRQLAAERHHQAGQDP